MDQVDDSGASGSHHAASENIDLKCTEDNTYNNPNPSELEDFIMDKGPISVDNLGLENRDAVSEELEPLSVDEHVAKLQKSANEHKRDLCDETEHDMSGVELSVDHDKHATETVQGSQLENSNTQCSLTLTDLPLEILLHVASFMSPKDIICNLCQVCKTLYHIFAHDHYWKTRISLRWPGKYPVLDREDFNWMRACMEREEIHSQWSDPNQNFHHVMYKDGFFAAVDVVHLFQGGDLLAIGSRDRHLNIVDLRKYDCDKPNPCKDMQIFADHKIHKGWVWSMASCDNVLATGSWDTYVRLWNLGESGIQFFSHIKCKSALLGLHFEPNFIAAGGFDKRLYMVDPRAPADLTIKRYHTQPILSIAADDKYVITGSEDKVISIYDRVAGKNYKKIETDSFVLDLSYGDGQLWSGNKEGKLHLIDARDGLFDETTMQTIDVGHTGRLTGVIHTDGGLFTCSTDNHVKVSDPVLEPSIIADLTSHAAPVARISYNNGVLASAGSDIAVGIWMPKKDRKTLY